MLFTVDYMLKRHMAFWKANEVNLSVKRELYSFFKPALLCSKTRTISESSIDE
jgi:hypothetical protein